MAKSEARSKREGCPLAVSRCGSIHWSEYGVEITVPGRQDGLASKATQNPVRWSAHLFVALPAGSKQQAPDDSMPGACSLWSCRLTACYAVASAYSSTGGQVQTRFLSP